MKKITQLIRSFRRFIWKIKDVLTFIFLTTLFLIVIYFFDDYYKVKNIDIVGIEKSDDINGINILKGKNILLIEKNKIEDIIKEKNPYVAEVRLKKYNPDSLTIVIKKYKPFIAMESVEGYFILSNTARILEKQKEKPEELSVLASYNKYHFQIYQKGQYIDTEENLTAIKTAEKLNKIGFPVNTVDIRSLNMIVLTGENFDIIISAEKDIDTILEEIDSILLNLKRKNKKFKVLNLRFEKPIIIF